MKAEGPFAKLAGGFAVASTLGLGFAIATGLGIYLGYRCDRAFGWKFFGCTLTLGAAGGGVGLVFILKTLAALDRPGRSGPGGSAKPTPDAGVGGPDHEDS